MQGVSTVGSDAGSGDCVEFSYRAGGVTRAALFRATVIWSGSRKATLSAGD